MTFRLGNCRVTVSFYFFAMTALACCIDGGDILLSGMLAAAIHESGHILAMIAIPGQRIDSLDITALGIRITSQQGDMTRGWWITAAAGIIANLAAAGVAVLEYIAYHGTHLAERRHFFIYVCQFKSPFSEMTSMPFSARRDSVFSLSSTLAMM